MNDEPGGFSLRCRHDYPERPILTGVTAKGRVDGALFDLVVRQTYRNTTANVLEVVYTFPLPHGAVLLGFATELNGERKDAVVIEKIAAEQRYEDGMADGDAPVMLEAVGNGLHTANIGNLKPDDEIVLEVRIAQLLMFEQGRLRLAIPTTVAPRYGNAAQAGLQPQQVPQASLQVEYPLALSVVVAGALADSAIECATHRIAFRPVDGGIQIDLLPGATLDRDVVILIQPGQARSSLTILAADPVSTTAPGVALSAFQPPVAMPRERIALKLLVDCSGSMGGDGIASARAALHGVLGDLRDHDVVSLSRFGSSVEHVLAPNTATRRTAQHLSPLIDRIQANLGGTEMEGALRSVFALPTTDPESWSDVLLITDCQIWQSDEMIAAARASRHRVFAIGVGSAPSGSVLRSLAEATGGACEFATPGEAVGAAARRMLTRIRQQLWRDVRVDWGATPVWQTPLPQHVFGEDTVIAMAGFAPGVTPRQPKLLAPDTAGGSVLLLAESAGASSVADGPLPRLAAARRMITADGPQALALAVDYQLISSQTNCILVHERAEAEKANEQAQLHKVSSMLAAGWGGMGSVVSLSCLELPGTFAERVPSLGYSSMDMRRERQGSVPRSARDDDRFDVPAVSAFRASAFSMPQVGVTPESLRTVALAIATHLASGGELLDLPDLCVNLPGEPGNAMRWLGMCHGTFKEPRTLVILAHWINTRDGGRMDPVIAAALKPYLAPIEASVIDECVALFKRHIPFAAWESAGW